MSAECGKCGSDIVYPKGTWPIGECPACTRDKTIEDYREAVDMIHSELMVGDYDSAKKWCEWVLAGSRRED